MSKIYEALLRAEQDRAEKDRNPPETAPTRQPNTAQPAAAHSDFGAALANTSATAPAEFSAAPAFVPPQVPEPIVSSPSFAASVTTPPVSTFVQPAAATLPETPRTAGDDRNFSPDRVRKFPWAPALASLPALEDRGSSVEQFRSLRSRMFEFRDLNKLKAIMVSSGLPQEGKSFIAANLSISFARHKASRVLLIDGDMRRSTLHKLLGASGEVGLAEYLAGTANLLDVTQQIEPSDDSTLPIHGLASLSFIPGGSDIEKAADLSGNPRFAQLIQAASPFYDWIIVDSAPVNLVADGVNLARACDGVLLVARAGTTKFESAQRALVELKASSILGFVLNAVESLPLTGGYYGYESYDSTQK